MSFRLPTVVSGITQSVAQLGHVVTGRGGGGRYFQSTKKGEIQELKDELHSSNKEKKKEAVKKVIAAMTVGKDVSGLFPDVVNCMQTTNIELKKLVYLYVINYAKVQPELAILAINTFRKDSLDSNPLIRALAVRTMGCIRLEQVVEYLVEPLRKACRDHDPYVRKTAVTCICKLYETSPETVEDQGFLNVLKDMLTDGNPSVVSNAVAALSEITVSSGRDVLNLDEALVSKLLTALGECSEWGQVFILDALAAYNPPTAKVATSVLERVSARLSHANAAVVLATVCVILKMLEHVNDAALVKATHKKLGPPLITLLSCENEVQYVALRNICLIVQKYPGVLVNEIKMFYCKYNDPYYIKLEKLDILVRLANEKNIEQVLMELKEYATEVDVEFVRRTIRAIGRCAVKLEKAAQKCVAALLSLIETKVNYVVQETIVVIKDIFRKYPNRYEAVISKLCASLESLDEPDAKAAMIWIIGEYAERIDNADELTESFVEGFLDEPVAVRQQLLTATVKFFLKCPNKAQDLVTRVLKLATEENDDPDLRDRAFIYWRLLSADPARTKQVVLASRPPITDTSFALESDLLDSLIEKISSLASVFHRRPEAFVTRLRLTAASTAPSTASEGDSSEGRMSPARVQKVMKETAHTYRSESSKSASSSASESSESEGSEKATDLLDLSDESEDHGKKGRIKGKKSARDSSRPAMDVVLLLAPTSAGTGGKLGLEIMGTIFRRKGNICLHLYITNRCGVTLVGSAWALQVNRNSFGLAPADPNALGIPDIPHDGQAEARVPLEPNKNLSHTAPAMPLTLQVAVKTSLDVFYLNPVPVSMAVLFCERGPVDKETFRNHWTRMGESKQVSHMGLFSSPTTSSEVTRILEKNNISVIVHREQDTFDTLYCSAVTTNSLLLLFEIALQKSGLGIKLTVKSDAPQTFPLLIDFFTRLLNIQSFSK